MEESYLEVIQLHHLKWPGDILGIKWIKRKDEKTHPFALTHFLSFIIWEINNLSKIVVCWALAAWSWGSHRFTKALLCTQTQCIIVFQWPSWWTGWVDKS